MIMNIKLIYIMVAISFLSATTVKSQSYTPNVPKDSLSVLKDRVLILKANLKIYELKIKEAEEETNVEKLRVRLIAANAKAKESATQNSDLSKKIGSGTLDAKAIERSARKAKNDMANSQSALESFNKQIKRVETIRSDIRIEEGKMNSIKPLIIFINK